tara:strand:- start:41 stop:439 length:399 start_codon:yes stop_codon:yes gene_type:complete
MLNEKQLDKIQNQIDDINQKLIVGNNSVYDDGQLFEQRNELEYKRNKDNINIRLPQKEKYYYAWQCHIFTCDVMANGYPYKDKERIKKEGISFNKYSINIGANQYGDDFKRFSSKEEMLGFVIGYNEAKKRG